jgi:hypothetical protein
MKYRRMMGAIAIRRETVPTEQDAQHLLPTLTLRSAEKLFSQADPARENLCL